MKHLSLFLLTIMAALSIVSCDTVDSDRIPPVNVNIIFPTIGDWERYGVAVAGFSRRFIASERQPAGFPYKGLEGTGYGGVLLIADPMGTPLAYDLACPECCPAVKRIVIDDTDQSLAGIYRCNNCGSTYDVFSMGTPRSGPALKNKFGLQRYRVAVTGGSPYAVITR